MRKKNNYRVCEDNNYYKFKTLREARAFIFGVQFVNDSHLVAKKPVKTLGGYIVRVIEYTESLDTETDTQEKTNFHIL